MGGFTAESTRLTAAQRTKAGWEDVRGAAWVRSPHMSPEGVAIYVRVFSWALRLRYPPGVIFLRCPLWVSVPQRLLL